mmetsp:Transcript_129723/g.416136  ORF Transcript_129723/g.416136 Transcript_129723/m.416136 type:complete len:583 (-) Transcript_129723:5252-7000(-)
MDGTEERVHRALRVRWHHEVRGREADLGDGGFALEGHGGGQRVHDGDRMHGLLAARRAQLDLPHLVGRHKLEHHLDGEEFLSLRVREHHPRDAAALPVCKDVELVLLRLAGRQIEGLHAVQPDLVPGVQRLDQGELHGEALGLAEPVRDLHGLNVWRLALHRRFDALHLGGCRGLADEVPDIGVPVGGRHEDLAAVPLGPELPRALGRLPRCGQGCRAPLGGVGLQMGPVLVLQRHRQRPIRDLEAHLASRRHRDLPGAEPVVNARRHLCLHHGVQFPRLAAGVLPIWREHNLLRRLLADARRELQGPHCALGLLDAPSLHDELHRILLVVRFNVAPDTLRLSLLGLPAQCRGIGAAAPLHGVKLHEELDVVMRCGEALRGLDREEGGSLLGHLESELHAQVAKVVKLDMPHARGLEDHIAEEQGVLGELHLSGVAGALDAEEVHILAEEHLGDQRQLEGGLAEGGVEPKLDRQLLLGPQADGLHRRPGHAAFGELAVGVHKVELHNLLGPVHDPDAAGHRPVADGDAEIDVLHGHGHELKLQLATPATDRYVGPGRVIDDKLDALPVLLVLTRCEDNGHNH